MMWQNMHVNLRRKRTLDFIQQQYIQIYNRFHYLKRLFDYFPWAINTTTSNTLDQLAKSLEEHSLLGRQLTQVHQKVLEHATIDIFFALL
jgi:hypothetical protein